MITLLFWVFFFPTVKIRNRQNNFSRLVFSRKILLFFFFQNQQIIHRDKKECSNQKNISKLGVDRAGDGGGAVY